MINLNLLPPSSKQRVRDRAYLIIIKNTVITLIVLMIINSVAVVGVRYYLDFRVKTLENEIEQLRASQNNTQSLNEAIDSVNQKSSYLKNVNNNYVYWSDKLLDMTQLIPNGINLTTVSIDAEAMILSIAGHSATRNELLTYKEHLEKLSYLSSINLPITNLTTQTDIVFQITAMINLEAS